MQTKKRKKLNPHALWGPFPALWGLASPPHPHESAGRFTPVVLGERLRRRRGGFAAALPVCFPLSTRVARPHHGAMAYGPVDACSCFCEADAMPVCFPRVAQSCSLLRTGTFPCSVSERLRYFKHCQRGLNTRTREKGQWDGRVMGHMRHIGHMGQKAPKGRASAR